MTKQQAKELCLIKWAYAMKTGCYPEGLYGLNSYLNKKCPSVWGLLNQCAYCDKYMTLGFCGDDKDKCKKCPLNKVWKGVNCFNRYSVFEKWQVAKTKKDRKKYAKIIHDDIKRS